MTGHTPDLSSQLRAAAGRSLSGLSVVYADPRLLREAADEIERFRAATHGLALDVVSAIVGAHVRLMLEPSTSGEDETEQLREMVDELDRWDGRCSRCGRDMPYLESSISQGDHTVYLCHPDDESLPDCYALWGNTIGGAS